MIILNFATFILQPLEITVLYRSTWIYEIGGSERLYTNRIENEIQMNRNAF